MNKVIAISGPPGSGKTSLMLELRKCIPAAFLEYDNYQKITERSVQEISNLLKDGADYDDFVIPLLAEDLRRLKTGESVIEPNTGRTIDAEAFIFFETPFAREHKESGRHIDVSVWIDVPLDVALARNLRAYNQIFLSHDHLEQVRDDLNWLDVYLANYLEHVRAMLISQHRKLRKSADIIIDGEMTLELMASKLMHELSPI